MASLPSETIARVKLLCGFTESYRNVVSVHYPYHRAHRIPPNPPDMLPCKSCAIPRRPCYLLTNGVCFDCVANE